MSFANTDVTAVPVQISGLTSKISCHYLIETTCGMPTVKIVQASETIATLDSADTADIAAGKGVGTLNKIGMSFVEWQKGFQGLVQDTVNSDYPDKKTTVVNYVPFQYNNPEGTLGNMVIPLGSGKFKEIPAKVIID